MQDGRADSYDTILYGSAPVPESHPGRMAVQARLFGLQSPDPDSARVLELGCAEGGNLLPLAFYQPRAQFLGIERSAAQVHRGQALIAAAGITNARIRQADVLDLGGDLGEFDYIIAHGLYSWVPGAVRERILSLCAHCLAPDGVAFVSFNTLPGWRMRGMLRDLLLFHARGASDARARFEGARELLGAFAGHLEGVPGLYAEYLRAEFSRLAGRDASYVFHEYLEEDNHPLLFADFMRDAQEHGLQYLCDTDLQYMFAGDFSAPTQAWLESIDDIVQREQYMDFLRGRNFRATLLCRDGHVLGGEIDTAQFDQWAFHALLEPRQSPNMRRVAEQPWATPGGREYRVSHPLTKAALVHLAGIFPDSVAAPDLLREAQAAVTRAGGQSAGQGDHLMAELVGLYIRQAVGVDLRPQAWRETPGAHPRAAALARAQAAAQWQQLATPRHAGLDSDELARAVIVALDGGTPAEAVAQQVAAAHGLEAAQARDNVLRLMTLFARHGIVTQPAAR